ncbi:phosphoribosyltransferase [Natronosporangium hydrolyticum]|uniref:Phosphoribosyltransferase n=1 Tax=Natronosporangium hydrolyticum TaxID=2811111 RepID=A0A895YDY3_9ACTN|nr:phosphoribosyltransferase family protein [Natronosporangium hydrolyticum]QSB14385.1 phosphoribosyltransferase [Natronosporangium hydrolyticum]
MATTYPDRAAAGAVLAAHLPEYADRDDVIVLGLVRGGVPVAAAVADQLAAPLDVLVVRKLGVPGAPELAFGAIGPGGVLVRNEEIAAQLTAEEITTVQHQEEAERSRREERYRSGRGPLALSGRVAIVVDDGLATGATALAAVTVARALGAERVVLAAPVAAPEALDRLRQAADEIVCPLAPPNFGAVSRFYDTFDQTSDAEVTALLI